MPPPNPSGEVGRVMGSGEAARLAYTAIASGEPTLSKSRGGTALRPKMSDGAQGTTLMCKSVDCCMLRKPTSAPGILCYLIRSANISGMHSIVAQPCNAMSSVTDVPNR